MHDCYEIEAELFRFKSEWAAFTALQSLSKLRRCFERRACHPEQPRERARPWTPFGGLALADRRKQEGVRVAQNGPHLPRLPILRINGRDVFISSQT